MAQRGKGTTNGTGRRKSASGGSASARTSTKKTGGVKKENKKTAAKKKSFLVTEISSIMLIAAGFFLLLTDFGLMGGIGEALRGFQRGLFGQAFWLFGVFLALFALLSYYERGKYLGRFKLCALIIGFVALDAIIHLMFAERRPLAEGARLTLSELYTMGSNGASGGGLVGGAVAGGLQQLAGNAGAYFLLIVILIICFVVITEISFVNVARLGAGKTVEMAGKGRERYIDHRNNVRIRREELRAERAAELEERAERLKKERQARLDAERTAGQNAGRDSELYARRSSRLDSGRAVDPQVNDNGQPYRKGRPNPIVLGNGLTDSSDAERYVEYGREIIGSEQPHREDSGRLTEPFIRKSHRPGFNTAGMNFDTDVISSLPDERENIRRPVNIKEINYDEDTVPFDETPEEKYKSYTEIIKQGVMNAETASLAGFAVGSLGSYHEAGAFDSISTESFDAFKERPDEGNADDGRRHGPIIVLGEVTGEDKGQGAEDNNRISTFYTDTGAVSDPDGSVSSYAGQDEGDHYGGTYTTDTGKELEAPNPYEDEDSDPDGPVSSYAGPAEDDQDYKDKDSATDIGAGYGLGGSRYAGLDENSDYQDGETYLTATGKELEAPDPYEAELILKEKLKSSAQDNNAAAAQSGGPNTRPDQSPDTRPNSDNPEARLNAIPNDGNQNTRPNGVSPNVRPNARPNDGNPNIRPNARPQERPQPQPKKKPRPYVYPDPKLLSKSAKTTAGSREDVINNARKLERVLREFGVGVKVTNIIRGPRVSRYELVPDTGVKVSRITTLEGDIKLALAASELRIEAPIPGKSAVGIEVPNAESTTVRFGDILESEEFKSAKSPLTWGIGIDIQGKPVIGNIAKMPHVLVAGTTGSGKSVGINTLIMSILYKSSPDEVRMILIDPKVVELSVYNGIPHLIENVVTQPERAITALNWAVSEMNKRYLLFRESATRNIAGYNEKVERTLSQLPPDTEYELKPKKLPYILIVIDELSELMLHSKKDVEQAIVSITQLARAAGIHLVVATQRPSVDVITGLIKSNIPSRIAYRLPSATDSRTILDSGGAESLLGNGDMLYKPGDRNSPDRVQGAFLSDEEVEAVVDFVRKNNSSAEVIEGFEEAMNAQEGPKQDGKDQASDRDEYYIDAGRLIISTGRSSIGDLQRKFKIGFNRAARIMDQLHEDGVVSDGEGTKKRQVLMSIDEFEELIQQMGL